MTESVITEFAGSQRESISRIYRYDVSGVRVLDSHDHIRRLYRFDPSSSTMTENDPAQPGKILRRFAFDNFGMLEESFSFGHPPRTFRFESGGRQIVMREGGNYGAVGKMFSFERNGVSETAFGRNGEIERVYIFDPEKETIIIRSGGWYGSVERTLVCERIDVSVFHEPEAFLQFLIFTEKSAREVETDVDEQVAKIRNTSSAAPGRSRYAYTGTRHTSDLDECPGEITTSRSPLRPALRSDDHHSPSPVRLKAKDPSDTGIDFIPDSDSSFPQASAGNPMVRERNCGVQFEKGRQSAAVEKKDLSEGRSARIPLEERFRSSREEDRTLSEGRSAQIPLEERFQSSRDEDRTLSEGKSSLISYEERKSGRRQQ